MTAENTRSNILVIRQGALGDVLLTTPVVARLKKENPQSQIYIQTGSPQAYEGNPHIAGINRHDVKFDRVISLDMVYESNPKMHIVDAYMFEAFGDFKGNKRVVFGISPPLLPELKIQNNVIVLHATRSWPSRSLPNQYWDDLADLLFDAGFVTYVLGGASDYCPANRVYDRRGLSLRDTANEIANARAAILSDSSLIHLAGATDTPVVGLFTSVRAEYRLPYRGNVLGLNCKVMSPQGLPCYGCLEMQPAPVTSLSCGHSDKDVCTRMISAFETFKKMMELL